jgi:hypothetical protein
MTLNDNAFITFLLCSYCMGWCINGLFAIDNQRLDLCQFLRSFVLAPFAVCATFVLLFTGFQLFIKILIPNCWISLIVITSVIGAALILKLIGQYAVAPAVKKMYGVAKPFSERLCIVLYRRNP